MGYTCIASKDAILIIRGRYWDGNFLIFDSDEYDHHCHVMALIAEEFCTWEDDILMK